MTKENLRKSKLFKIAHKIAGLVVFLSLKSKFICLLETLLPFQETKIFILDLFSSKQLSQRIHTNNVIKLSSKSHSNCVLIHSLENRNH